MAEAEKRHDIKVTYPLLNNKDGGAPFLESNSVDAIESNTSVTVHDFHRLMETFTHEVKLTVPCSGVKYKAENLNQHFLSGVLEQYLCCYEIKVGDNSFGYVYFARDTQFKSAELKILEDMVAGLALPLCHLFMGENCDDNTPENELDH